MDLVRIAGRVALVDPTAAVNPEATTAIANLIKEIITPLLEHFGPDFGHDALSTGTRGMSEGEMSFPVRPKLFDEQNLNGDLIVNVKLNPPVQGSGKAIADTVTTATFGVGYYFKTPKFKGSGKTMKFEGGKWVPGTVPAGSVEIKFDASGNPTVEDSTPLVAVTDALEMTAGQVVESPPEGAHSLSRDPQHRKEQAELNEIARREKAEKAREKEQADAARAQKEADMHTHGSIEAFEAYMDEQDEEEVGPGDVQKLLNTQFPDPASRALARAEVIKQLEAAGFVYNPKKRHVSSRRPDFLEMVSYI